MDAHRQLAQIDRREAEPHYVLTHREGAVRVEHGERWQVDRPEDARWMVEEPGAWWGYSGSGPMTTAKVLLDDACVGIADQLEARAFASEVLAKLNPRAVVERVTVAEVQAWWRERRRSAVGDAEAGAERILSLEDQIKALERLLEEPVPEGLIWFERRREAHPPKFA